MKRILARLAIAAALAAAGSAASANIFCVTSGTTARSGPGHHHASAGHHKAGNTVYGLFSVGGWRKILSPSGRIYFMPNGSLSRGECKVVQQKRRVVVHPAPVQKHRPHCGGCRAKHY